MYRFTPVDRSPTVYSQAAAIAAAAPLAKDRDNTYVVCYDTKPPKSKKMKKSHATAAVDSYSSMASKSTKERKPHAQNGYTPPTQKSKNAIKSQVDAVLHPFSTPMTKNNVQSPDVMVLPPPPKPPQIFGLDDHSTEKNLVPCPLSPWTRHLASNGLHYFYNPSTGECSYQSPPGWPSPSSTPSPSQLESTASSWEENAVNEQGEAPDKKKMRMQNVKRMSSLVESAKRCNVPVETLERLMTDVSCVSPSANDGKAQWYRNSYDEQKKFEQDLHAKMAFARLNARDATLQLVMAEKHLRDATCCADVIENIQQGIHRASGRNEVKSFEAEDKENHKNARLDESTGERTTVPETH